MPLPQTEVSISLAGEEIFFRLLPPGEYVIGSADDAEIHFAAADLAPKHARLILGARDHIIQDLGSSSGTFVGGERVRNVRVVPDAHPIQIAGSSISLRRVLDSVPTIGDSALSGPTVSLIRVSENGGGPAAAPTGPISFPKRKYDIGRLVATGGMGAILDAYDTATERHVAMKIMADPARRDHRRFLLEARVTAKLEHPNIVPLHELAINQEGHPFYTMKLVQGVSLRKVFESLALKDPAAIQSYSLDSLLTIFQKICDAVAFAHSKGVLHRDLKPDNIMLGQYGEALVMDWGLAKVIGEPDLPKTDSSEVTLSNSGGSHDDTQAGDIMGTPSYMSPEQARGEIERLDARTDIYSLGAILYHYLTLEPPVSGKSKEEAVANACAGRIVAPSKFLGAKKVGYLPSGRVPESLDAVVMKALAHDPARRYPSVTDLQREIRAYQTGFATTAEQAGVWRLLKLFFMRHRVIAGSATAILLFGAVFLVYMIVEKHEADTQRRAAEAQRESAEARLYLAHMDQVRDDLDNGRPESAHELLELHRPRPKEKDWRAWEWYKALGQLNEDRLRVTRAHLNGAFALAASPDGALLASGGADGEIAIWRMRGLELEHRFPAHDAAVFALAWSRSGNLLASGGGKGMVRVWDAKTGRKLAETFSPAGRPVRTLSWNCANPDEPVLAFGGPLFDVYLWKPLANGEEAKPEILHKTKEGVSSLAWSADGAYLAFAQGDSAAGLEVIDRAGKSLAPKMPAPGSDIAALAIDPSDHYVAVGTRHRNVSVFEIPSGKKVFSRYLHTGMVNALAWSPDGKQLASVGDDCSVRIVAPLAASAADDRAALRTLAAYPQGLNAVVWVDLPGNEKADPVPVLAAVGADGSLREWATNGDSEFARKASWGAISSSRWSPDGNKIAVSTFQSNLINITDDGGTASFPLEAASYGVFDFQWSPKGDRLGIANREWQGLVEVVDAATGKWLNMFSLRNANRVAWDPTGNFLAAASIHVLGEEIPAKVCVWNLSTSREVASLQTSATSLAYSRDGKRLYLGGEDGSIHVWDGASQELGPALRPAPAPLLGAVRSKYEAPLQVFDLAVSPDEKFLAFVTQDGDAGVIDIQNAKLVCSFFGVPSGLRRVAWCSDGRRVATCGSDGVLRIFDAKEGAQLMHFVHGSGQEADVEGLDWRPDGRRILTGGWSMQIRIWDADRGLQIAQAEDSAKRELTESMSSSTLLDLARSYSRLGWTDLARRAYGLAAKANPTSPTLASEVAAAERSFDWALTPHIERNDSPEQLLTAVHANWRSDDEQALDKYRRLSAVPGGAHLLPLAHRYFSDCDWTVKWFASSADPVANVDAWRALADAPGAVGIGSSALLCFPYHGRSPRELGYTPKVTASALPVENWGMVATAKINLPAGKWRLQIEADGGARALVDDKIVITDAWNGDSKGLHSGEYTQQQTGEVTLSIEHFVTKPCQSFEFLLIPVVDGK